MSSGDAFHQRGAALENQFFSKVDQKLMEQLREQQNVDSLQKALGLDSNVAQSLHAAGVSVQSAAALRLAPLVAVAWADGRIEAAEREIVLKAAAAQGVESDQPAGQLLANWLSTPPSAEFMKSWVEYAAGLVAHLSPDAAAALKTSILSELQSVAKATGGVLGWASVSEGESKVMQTIEAALTRKNS